MRLHQLFFAFTVSAISIGVEGSSHSKRHVSKYHSTQCSRLQEACSTTKPCCNKALTCDASTKTCRLNRGQRCTISSDCCSKSTCKRGYCVAAGTQAAPPTSTRCRIGLGGACKLGSKEANKCCKEGSCKNGRCVKSSVPSCIATGSRNECQNDQDCCEKEARCTVGKCLVAAPSCIRDEGLCGEKDKCCNARAECKDGKCVIPPSPQTCPEGWDISPRCCLRNKEEVTGHIQRGCSTRDDCCDSKAVCTDNKCWVEEPAPTCPRGWRTSPTCCLTNASDGFLDGVAPIPCSKKEDCCDAAANCSRGSCAVPSLPPSCPTGWTKRDGTSTTCCLANDIMVPLGSNGCTQKGDCCDGESSCKDGQCVKQTTPANCPAGWDISASQENGCCLANNKKVSRGCTGTDNKDCCDKSATCQRGMCSKCLPSTEKQCGEGCISTRSTCCADFSSCLAGTSCGPSRSGKPCCVDDNATGGCEADEDCCNPNAKCNTREGSCSVPDDDPGNPCPGGVGDCPNGWTIRDTFEPKCCLRSQGWFLPNNPITGDLPCQGCTSSSQCCDQDGSPNGKAECRFVEDVAGGAGKNLCCRVEGAICPDNNPWACCSRTCVNGKCFGDLWAKVES